METFSHIMRFSSVSRHVLFPEAAWNIMEYALLKSDKQLTAWLIFTSEKPWKGREQFHWKLPSLTSISWGHKDNNSSPSKTGFWKFCKRVFMLS